MGVDGEGAASILTGWTLFDGCERAVMADDSVVFRLLLSIFRSDI